MALRRFVALLVLVLLLAALFASSLWKLVVPPPPETPRPTEAPLQVQAPPPAPVVEAPVAPRRLLEISGRVLGVGLQPVSDLTLSCGQESVSVAPTGVFSFPASVRPRAAVVQVLRAGTVLSRWEGVVVGDALTETGAAQAAEDGAAAEASVEEEDGGPSTKEWSEPPRPLPETEPAGLPPRPLRLRWTLNLIDPSGRARQENPPGGPQGEAPWIEITGSLCEEYGVGARVRVAGRSRLPDGAHVSVSLYFEGMRFISGEPAEVRRGSFEASMVCPTDVDLYSATYMVHASYNAVLQAFERKEAWTKSDPETDWESLYAETTQDIFVGDPDEARQEDWKVREYYSRVLDEAVRLDEELKSRVEEVLDLGMGWDLQRLRRDMDGVGFEDIVARSKDLNPALLRSRREARRGWFYTDVVKDGQFDEAAWRRFLDEEWRPRVRALIDAHSSRRQEKYTEAASRMGALLDTILRESLAFSRFVVYPSYLPKHENDFYFDEDTVGDLVRLESVLRDNFSKLERYRRIGLAEK